MSRFVLLQLQDVAVPGKLTVESLVTRMNEAANTHGNARISDLVVYFLRMLTSAELELRADFFEPFIMEDAVTAGFGRIAAFYCRSSTLYQICSGIRCVCI